jgi:hypothetical protein
MQSYLVLTANSYFKKATLIVSAVVLLQGCATVNGVPSGVLYSNIKGPLLIADGNQSTQVGYNDIAVSKSHSLFYIINWGDASIEKAIGTDLVAPGVRISHVDFEFWHLLGCGTYKTIVYYYNPSYHGPAHP